MVISKMGKDHYDIGKNCQDYGMINNGYKLVLDGCSEGLHSEVGVKLFAHMFSMGLVESAFEIIIDTMRFTPQDIKNYMCFTILYAVDLVDSFGVYYCGDGYIIKERIDGLIEFEKLDDGEYPKYMAYNYLDPCHLTHYKDGVRMQSKFFPKSEYNRVGVASDGLRYMFGKLYEWDIVACLKHDKEVKLRRLINKNISDFKDDITIVW